MTSARFGFSPQPNLMYTCEGPDGASGFVERLTIGTIYRYTRTIHIPSFSSFLNQLGLNQLRSAQDGKLVEFFFLSLYM